MIGADYSKASEMRLGLERIRELLDRMGRPQDRLKFVHVAGTNGKGSVCAYVAEMLQANGYAVGLFTSPVILGFSDHIRVSGKPIALTELSEVEGFVELHVEAMEAAGFDRPTPFERVVAVAFEHFARAACDIVVCEVGLGGRLDATNVISAPEACVITRLGLDHTGTLGESLAEIACEKAGIIKPGTAVVCWPQDDASAMDAIAARAAQSHADVVVPDFSCVEVGRVDAAMRRRFDYRGRTYATRLLGIYQPFNAALALHVLWALRDRGWKVNDELMAQGVESVSCLPGRFETAGVAGNGAPIVVDGGHNEQGAEALFASLQDVFPHKRAVFVIGVLADKGYEAMIARLAPIAKAFICVSPPNDRALSAASLADAVARLAGPTVAVEVAEGYEDACSLAFGRSDGDDLICFCGSLYGVAPAHRALQAGLPELDAGFLEGER